MVKHMVKGCKTRTTCLAMTDRELIRHALRMISAPDSRADDMTKRRAIELDNLLQGADIDIHSDTPIKRDADQ